MSRHLCILLSVIPLLPICRGEKPSPQQLCQNPSSFSGAFQKLCVISENCEEPSNLGNPKENDTQLSTKPLETIYSQPYPWTSKPWCAHGDSFKTTFCVWTDTSFAKGRGVSIVASPSSVQTVARDLLAFGQHDISLNSNGDSNALFEVQKLPGRGFGLVANQTIKPGDNIFTYTPILAVEYAVEKHFKDEKLFQLLRVAIERLPARTKESFLALHGHFGGDHLYDRYNTNAFNAFGYTAVFPEAARLNHDCRPNSDYFFNKTTLTHNVHAAREIKSGEEITISYMNPYTSFQTQSHRMGNKWGFDCSCSICGATKDYIAASDSRLSQIKKLELQLKESPSSRKANPAMAEKLISLYRDERLWTPIANAYRIAALEYSNVGNQEMTRKYATLAMEIDKIWRGPSSAEVRSMSELVRH